jgi:hypothetical protein
MKNRSELIEALQKGIVMVPFCTCWIFAEAGRENRNGYGRLRWGGRELMAHKLSYEAHIGPIPKGLILDHTCRMRACINPAHLEPVTHQVNTLRGEALLFGRDVDPVTRQRKEKEELCSQ